MNYFNNKIIIIYPFIPFVIKGENDYSGLNFGLLDIKHYIPRYINCNIIEDNQLKEFFDGLLRQIITKDGKYLLGLGYSVHTYDGSEEEKEEILNTIRNQIELLYFLFQHDNHSFSSSFPKFYFVDRVNKFDNEEYLYSFELWEGIEKSSHHLILKKDSKRLEQERISLEIKTDQFIQEPNFRDYWKESIKELDNEFFRGLFWANNVKDQEKRIIEKIISAAIAIETLVEIPRGYKEKYSVSEWSEAFAKLVMEDLHSQYSGIEGIYLKRIERALIQAANVRSNVVHGRELYEFFYANNRIVAEKDIRINFDGDRYIYIHDFLYEIFDIIVHKKISKDEITSGIRFQTLVDRIYPNKDIINSAMQFLEKDEIEFFEFLKTFKNLKRHDHNGINNCYIGRIIKYINDHKKSIEKEKVDFDEIPKLTDLINSENGWLMLHELAEKIGKPSNDEVWNKRKLKIYGGVRGLEKFIVFLSDFVMNKHLEKRRSKKITDCQQS